MKSLFDYLNETVYASKPRAEYIIKSLTDAMGVEITGSIKTIMSNEVLPDPDEVVELYVQTCKTPNGKKCNIYVWPNEWVTICDSKGGFVRFETKGYGKEYAIFDPEYRAEWKYQKDDRYIQQVIEWKSVKNWPEVIKDFR